MAGIYLHIPFCKKACHYCNFHFSTNLNLKEELVDALCLELTLRKQELNAPIETIYFGGGTPSLLNSSELKKIFDCIEKHYNLSSDPEISLEANPDDLTKEVLKNLYASPINRLSIGVQSFFEEDLKYMNRSHDAHQATACIENALNVGFDNLSIDLIYGSPSSDFDKWSKNLEKTFAYQIPHLSCYALTVEPETALDHFIKKGKVPKPNEKEAEEQFQYLIQEGKSNGFEQYEISNFARDKKYSRHNTSYWQGKKYLGIGPSAHSFDGEKRTWNISNNPKYLKAIANWKNDSKFNPEGHLFDLEKLSEADRFNEYIMTGLRTIWGIKEDRLKNDFSPKIFKHFQEIADQKIKLEQLILNEGVYTIPTKAKFMADGIASDLFYV